jgi:hypothetical protein
MGGTTTQTRQTIQTRQTTSKCDVLIKIDRMHSLIAHFQDLSKDDSLVMVKSG